MFFFACVCTIELNIYSLHDIFDSSIGLGVLPRLAVDIRLGERTWSHPF